MLRKVLFCIAVSFLSFALNAQDNLKDQADDISPLLTDAKVFYENDNVKYRYLLFTRGWEHITTLLVVQKFTADSDYPQSDYILAASEAFYGLGNEYVFAVESVVKTGDGFLFTLPGWHSYYNVETVLTVLIDTDCNIIEETGLVSED